MKRHRTCLGIFLALSPGLVVLGANGCGAEVLRSLSEELDEEANRIDGSEDDVDLGDYLADIVDDL